MGNRMFLFFLAGLIVPFQMNIVSLYNIVKSLHLMNTPFAVILVNVAINTPQAVFLFKEFIEGTVPKELEEAAEIDGCTVFRKFFRVVLPLL
ncbi:ABC transporter permease subunit, partial [Hungatella sp. SL.1.14]|uniref:ABC transporter permease subunit n=1 Tax=Hungatella sp. SL.1.14 TaxID=2963703 RepID=UPI00210B91A0